MKLLIINVVCGVKSTGRIATDIAKKYEADGNEVRIAYAREQVPDSCKKYAIRIGNKIDYLSHALSARLFDSAGFGSKYSTRKFLKWAQNYDPDEVWLHNINGYYINIDMLFAWIKSRPQMKVKWTLHDCWAFTGHCTHFTLVGCDKWKTECHDCVQKNIYPKAIFKDASRDNYRRKKRAFLGVENMILYTPSIWLKNRVDNSFLGEYPVIVMPNTISEDVFRPVESDIRNEFGISKEEKMVLAVSVSWTKSKGIEDLIEVVSRLHDRFRFVVVGLNKSQEKKFPNNIVSIKKVNTDMLVKLYSSADFFINPSHEETFGMTTLEAIKCGARVIVYKGTACEEVVDSNGGIAVDENIDSLCEALLHEA